MQEPDTTGGGSAKAGVDESDAIGMHLDDVWARWQGRVLEDVDEVIACVDRAGRTAEGRAVELESAGRLVHDIVGVLGVLQLRDACAAALRIQELLREARRDAAGSDVEELRSHLVAMRRGLADPGITASS